MSKTTAEVSRLQKEPLNFILGVDFVLTQEKLMERPVGLTTPPSDDDFKITIIKLTPEGIQKRQEIIDNLFHANPERTRSIPLGPKFKIEDLKKDDVIEMDGLFALSRIRRRTGGYVCTLTDNFEKLREIRYLAVVKNVNPATNQVQLLLDQWPREFTTIGYVESTRRMEKTFEPLSIGPVITIDFENLCNGKPGEDFLEWFTNLIRRNILGQGKH